MCDGRTDCELVTDELHCAVITNNSLITQIHKSQKMFCVTFNMTIDGSLVSDGIPDCPWFDDVTYDIPPIIPGLPFLFGADDEPQLTDEAEHLPCIYNIVHSLPCKYTHHLSPCIPFEKLCIYDKNKLGRLKHCRKGGHLTSCASIACVGLFKCPLSYLLTFGGYVVKEHKTSFILVKGILLNTRASYRNTS